MKLYRLTALLAGSALDTSFSSNRRAVESGQPYTGQINWPENYKPENAGFFIHNHILIEASPETVWSILIEAESWPIWYKGARTVTVLDSSDSKLKADSVFTWETMGLFFESTVTEFEPPYRLSWESRKWSIRGIMPG